MVMRADQRGMFLIEALFAILIFSTGILALVAIQTKAITTQTDAQYRVEAANLVDQIVGQIWLGVDRSNATNLQTTLAAFQHRPSGSNCNFSGTASANAAVTAWVASNRLPGSTSAMQQIIVNTAAGSFNQVSVTVCWKGPLDATPHRHTVITYVN